MVVTSFFGGNNYDTVSQQLSSWLETQKRIFRDENFSHSENVTLLHIHTLRKATSRCRQQRLTDRGTSGRSHLGSRLRTPLSIAGRAAGQNNKLHGRPSIQGTFHPPPCPGPTTPSSHGRLECSPGWTMCQAMKQASINLRGVKS